MTRLLLVNPFHLNRSALEQEWLTPYLPLGLLYLAAAARRVDYDVSVYDGTFMDDPAVFAEHLPRLAPDVVCLGSLTTTRPEAREMARMARAHGAWVLAGGPDPTREPAAYLDPDGVQVIIRGEGEQTLVEALEAHRVGKGLKEVPGLALPGTNGQPVLTADRTPIEDLASLTHPARDLVDIEPYFEIWREAHGYTSLTLAASRGCHLDCEHCRNSAMGSRWRLRSPQSVVAEMKQLQEAYHPDRFRLVDDLDGLGENWLRALAAEMMAHGVTTPYEGLRLHQSLGELPMLERTKELCAERNAWIPKAAPHPHAPPALELTELQERWRSAKLRPGVTLPDP